MYCVQVEGTWTCAVLYDSQRQPASGAPGRATCGSVRSSVVIEWVAVIAVATTAHGQDGGTDRAAGTATAEAVVDRGQQVIVRWCVCRVLRQARPRSGPRWRPSAVDLLGRGERGAQGGQRTVDLRADGGGRAVEDLGDLGVGQVLVVPQDDGGPLLGRQRRAQRPDRVLLRLRLRMIRAGEARTDPRSVSPGGRTSASGRCRRSRSTGGRTPRGRCPADPRPP